MRKFTDKSRESANLARFRKILESEPLDYPQIRHPGQIIQRANGQELIVELIPWGRCTQWRAVFPDGAEIKGGMGEIHAEIRKRMPPLHSY